MSPDRNRPGTSPPRALAGAFGVLAIVLVAGLAASAPAERADVLGKTRTAPKPACPDKPRTEATECQITGQVTGYQRSVDGKANLFKAPRNGKIVAWSIDLAKPSKQERRVFGNAASTREFGESPTAGIAVLRKKQNAEFRLQRASPILEVQSYYGDQPIFTLRQPLRIKKGNIVALTTATWLPAFAFKGQGRDDVWVASRNRQNCEIPNRVPADERLDYFFAHTKPHRNVGSDRKYQCEYDNARLLYWAYFVPNR